MNTVFSAIAEHTPIDIPSVVKIGLEQEGFVTAMPTKTYDEGQERLEELPGITRLYSDVKSRVDELAAQVCEMDGNLNSRWHRFWSFSWLGSDKLEQEKVQLRGLQRDLAGETEAQSEVRTQYEELSSLSEHLSQFTRTSEGYLALSQRGRAILQDLNRFAPVVDEKESLKRMLSRIEACSDVETAYKWFRESGVLYSSHHAPALTTTALFSEKSFEEIGEIYQQVRAAGVYSSHHAPALTGIAVRAGKSAEEVVAIYNEFRNAGNLYSSNHAPSLVGTALRSGKPVEEVAALYTEFRNSGALYSSDEAAPLVGVAVGKNRRVEEVLEVYQQIRQSGDLYSSKHAPTLVATSIESGKSPEAVLAIYKDVRATGGLYTSHHAPVMAMLVAKSGKSIDEVMAYYGKVREDGYLYSSKHAASVAAAVLGVFASSEQSGIDLDSTSSVSSSSSYDSYSSSSGGFDMGWAVAGDIMDNGSMDLSTGFIVGGMMGGLFD
jgi:hypothetical protein